MCLPKAANAALILRYRSVQVPVSEHERIRRMFSSTSELRLRTFCETPLGIQHVLRLVLDGKLHIDWCHGVLTKIVTPAGVCTPPADACTATAPAVTLDGS